jgi:hypothetical protein
MTMRRALCAVRDSLAELASSVRELGVAIDDCPSPGGDLAVVDALRAHAADVDGDVSETALATSAALDVEEAGDSTRAARVLADAHERFRGLARRVRFDLSAHGTLFEVDRLPERHGARWRSWSDVVLRQLEQVDHAVHRGDAAFVGCWQELVDRLPANVSITTTQNVGVAPRVQQEQPAAL